MLVKNFNKINVTPQHNDKLLVGGKGYALGQLSHLDVNVPNGFVVTTKAYTDFLARNHINLQDDDVQLKIETGVFSIAVEQEIKEKLSQLRGEYFAVRSSSVSEDSADRSFAGIFDSFLNVTKDNVIAAIKKCYLSTLSSRAKYYLKGSEAIAVVVQEMVNSVASGVMFTQHPLTGSQSEVFIESCQGLGELLVSGQITPDSYRVSKASGLILEKHKGSQTTRLVRCNGQNVLESCDKDKKYLNAYHIRQLAATARVIEDFYQHPCDIEWCLDEQGIHIVQARPITAVSNLQPQEVTTREYNKRFSSRILSPIFEEANVKGYHHYAKEQFELPFELSGYHVYQPSMLHPNGEVDVWIDEDLNNQLNAYLKDKIKLDVFYLERLEKKYLQCVDEFTHFCSALDNIDYTTYSNEALVKILQDFDILNQRMTTIYNAPIFALMTLYEILYEEMICTGSSSPDADFVVLSLNCISSSAFHQELDFLNILLTAKEKYNFSQWSDDIPKHPEIKELLYQYHRRWRFLACTDIIGDAYNFSDYEAKLKEEYNIDAREKYLSLKSYDAEELKILQEKMEKYTNLSYEINWMRKWLYHRNNTTEYYYRDFQHLRPLLQTVAGRLSISYRELLNFSIADIVSALSFENIDIPRILLRAKEGFTLLQEGDKFTLKTGIDFAERIEKRVVSKDELVGQIANKGKVEGTVKIIKDPIKDAHKFNLGDILVTGMTTPSFVPLLELAAGIITDEGGILCHAALISREMNKPCLIGVHNATQILKHGDRVMLDAFTGIVRISTKVSNSSC
jgi:phosphoenolpyruvate synthase/pyruvate phosphate dikinase